MSMHIMPRGHIETDPSASSYFVTLSLEYPKAPCLIWILASVVRSQIGLFVFQMLASSVVRSLFGNPVSIVYQHRSHNGGILEVA